MMKLMVGTLLLFLACSPVYALKIYKLQGNQFAIICEDGTGYSFSGSSNGAQEAGQLLCDGHSGIVDVQNTVSAKAAMKRLSNGRVPSASALRGKEVEKASPKLME